MKTLPYRWNFGNTKRKKRQRASKCKNRKNEFKIREYGSKLLAQFIKATDRPHLINNIGKTYYSSLRSLLISSQGSALIDAIMPRRKKFKNFLHYLNWVRYFCGIKIDFLKIRSSRIKSDDQDWWNILLHEKRKVCKSYQKFCQYLYKPCAFNAGNSHHLPNGKGKLWYDSLC